MQFSTAYKEVFYAHVKDAKEDKGGKFHEKCGVKLSIEGFDFFLVRECSCWIVFEARSGCKVIANFWLDELKEALADVASKPTFGKSVEAAIKENGISPIYRQLSLFIED